MGATGKSSSATTETLERYCRGNYLKRNAKAEARMRASRRVNGAIGDYGRRVCEADLSRLVHR